MDKTKTLIVIDPQIDFIYGSLRNEQAIKAVPNIVKKINEFNGDTIFVTQDTHFKDYLNTKEGRNLPVQHCIKGTLGWDIHCGIKKALDDAEKKGVKVFYIEKNTFGSTTLVNKLKQMLSELEWENYATSQIEFIGFCTDICVVSNVLLTKAEFYDTNIIVDSSCCAGSTPESHEAALLTMKMCQIKII